MLYWIDAIAIVAGYLIGSISFAIVISNLLHLPDPRTIHSKNPGATNVSRDGHWVAGLLTLVGDGLKAIVPITLAAHFNLAMPTLGLVGLAAFLGHSFPAYHHFRGGKGVATLMGCLIAWQVEVALICMGIWLLVVVISRYMSLASMVAATAAPCLIWWKSESLFLSAVIMLMAAMLIVKHHTNIRLLLAGEEDKVGR